MIFERFFFEKTSAIDSSDNSTDVEDFVAEFFSTFLIPKLGAE